MTRAHNVGRYKAVPRCDSSCPCDTCMVCGFMDLHVEAALLGLAGPPFYGPLTSATLAEYARDCVKLGIPAPAWGGRL